MAADNKDPFGFADLFKQFSDSINEGIEQTKRAVTCKMRRFYLVSKETKGILGYGVDFPDGTAVVQRVNTGILNIYRGVQIFGVDEDIQWIDPEKQ